MEAPRPPPPAVVRSATNQDDEIAPVAAATTGGALMCNITLLLPTGNRHPFKIDDRYLNKRGVEVPELTDAGLKDPFSISVYKLKELILREWREDWESKPASPSSIRLIHFGKLLDDKEQLKSKSGPLVRVAPAPLALHIVWLLTTHSQNTTLAQTRQTSSTCLSSPPR